MRAATSPRRNRQHFWEALGRAYTILVNYTFLVYNENTLRYVYSNSEKWLHKVFF